ncbi:MAG: M3 family oligoendopeptidase [Anaerolineales bacterium]|jgi:oligoendopeptidase F
MITSLPDNALETLNWEWIRFAPYYQELSDCPLNPEILPEWLADWSRVSEIVRETANRLYIATTVDTNDQNAEEMYNFFLDEIYPQAESAEQRLRQKLLESGLKPSGFGLQLRNMQAEADIYREENLPLLSQEFKLSTEYDKIIGAQTITWEEEEITLPQLQRVFQDPNREKREKAWRLAAQRQLEDRSAIDELWVRFLNLRQKIFQNANFPDFRAYRWVNLLRFDYTPENCLQFHDSIEKVVVPAAVRLYEKRRKNLNLGTLRPWDLNIDPYNKPPLRPFSNVDELVNTTQRIFNRVDPELGAYFAIMRSEGLLDLENRKGKAPGGYCESLPAVKRPFIFMNAVGIHDDVQTMIHEGGHAFHVFDTVHLPYLQQRDIGMEIAEVASMGMELLAAPYLSRETGGFYPPQDAARARIEHLSDALFFWPYMAVVDAFQHWVYLNHRTALDPAECDRKWSELWGRFMPGVDWSGLDDEMETGWQRKLHIHQVPFYYVEYGLAQLGAFQIWGNAIHNQAQAVADYRHMLSLGATATLPELFNAAGAKFAFDESTLQSAVDLAESTITDLEELVKG